VASESMQKEQPRFSSSSPAAVVVAKLMLCFSAVEVEEPWLPGVERKMEVEPSSLLTKAASSIVAEEMVAEVAEEMVAEVAEEMVAEVAEEWILETKRIAPGSERYYLLLAQLGKP